MSSSSTSSTQTHTQTQTQTLIPGLPEDIAALILSYLPISHQSRLRSTSKSWASFLSTPKIIPLRRHLNLPPFHLLCLFPSDPSLSPPLLFDPISYPSSWSPLPLFPCNPHVYGLSNFLPLSLGPRIFLLGGSHFDNRSFPLGLPLPSSSAHSLDLSASHRPGAWSPLPDMPSPRGSFACAAAFDDRFVVVAGGGSRHAMYPSDGTRISSVERFDVRSGEWRVEEGMPRERAGCVGFVVRREEEEFWVMGGYGDYRTVSGVVPEDVYCRDAVVLGLRSGKWREVGDMWEVGERRKLGPVAVVEGEETEEPGVFMLDQNKIFR